MSIQRILLIGILMLMLVVSSTSAFTIATTTPSSSSRCQQQRVFHTEITASYARTKIFLSQNKNDDDGSSIQQQQEVVFVEPGSESDALSDDLWEEIEGAQPPKWIVMKEILGIGGFTYVLAALIVGMLSLNFFLGPGWLGQAMGVPGTGTFTETSPSLPDQMDLSADDFLF
mmetsp:Transcript_7997/g.13233  ORF Transcript_7997/g.13233 Transcript_7997/m.13233 type:complete len:172 (-) Transcript_7997:232-747(-)|eukprot:CAMPEP_0119027188 /NCGR_PEP_ID=MMETSP1176-20130426/36687_1 /TAXON_ID=265551 /ORGANISM="Synedropsis recta cf, Strain CCMP1620" /LENGTH=171 /DNA_ID=CAMNT_0006983047 /DNA_START=112 /DNA_END=627 /DNA_ORIENTATION=-